MKILEAIPLLIFVVYIKLINTASLENWRSPFVIGGTAALIVILLFFYKKIIFDRMLLGVNLYLISGSLAFITRQLWLAGIYNQLQASGMILWIIATGITAIFLSPKGFIGVDSSDKNSIKKYSIYLLLFSVIAFTVSFRMRGNILFSELVPFTCLFLLQRLFKNLPKLKHLKH